MFNIVSRWLVKAQSVSSCGDTIQTSLTLANAFNDLIQQHVIINDQCTFQSSLLQCLHDILKCT